jgi:4-amino-4-deoxy-L-arabinose transferase-like glycosyltransferase
MPNSELKTNKSSFLMIGVQYFLLALLVIIIISVIILSCVPPVSRDALTHHLAVPKLYLMNGAISEIPSILFSYYPMNLDLLYMIPLYFGNDIVPKFIHFAFALLTAFLIYMYLKKKLDTQFALLGVLFFLSLPIIVKLSINVYVDLGLIFFSTASILSLLKWNERRFQIRYLVLSGIFCGLALGTKYNGLLIFFILAISIPIAYVSQSKKRLSDPSLIRKNQSLKYQFGAIGYAAIFGIVSMLVFSPWMIRNLHWKGNPVYPLYNHWFSSKQSKAVSILENDILKNSNSEAVITTRQSSKRWSPIALRRIIYKETWPEIALIPIRIFFHGQDDNPKYFDGKLNPFLFFLPFFAFLRLKNDAQTLRFEKKFFLLFAILFILYAYFQIDMRIRYVAPVIPPLIILSILGLHQIYQWLIERCKKLPQWTVSVGFVSFTLVIIAFNVGYLRDQFNHVKPFSYISGRIDRNAYITKYRPEYAALRYSNQNLPDSAKLLGLFLGNRRYYSDRELIFGNNQFRKVVKEAASDGDILSALRGRGFTHIFVRFDLFNKWAAVQFNAREKTILDAFFKKNVRLLIAKGGYGLFQLAT